MARRGRRGDADRGGALSGGREEAAGSADRRGDEEVEGARRPAEAQSVAGVATRLVERDAARGRIDERGSWEAEVALGLFVHTLRSARSESVAPHLLRQSQGVIPRRIKLVGRRSVE